MSALTHQIEADLTTAETAVDFIPTNLYSTSKEKLGAEVKKSAKDVWADE